MHHVQPRQLARGVLTLLLLVAPLSSPAQIGSEWSLSEVGGVVLVGDIASGPGLEALVSTNLGTLELRSLDRGEHLGDMPEPFSLIDANTTYWLRDVDTDGLAEIVAFRVESRGGGTGQGNLLGIVDYANGRLVQLWSPLGFEFGGATLEFVDLSTSEPFAMAVYGPFLQIISSQSGMVRYDSSVELGSTWSVASLLVGDFDLDQREEALVQFRDSATSNFRMDLIGDTSMASAIESSPLSSQTLWQSHPNPTSGSTLIQFNLTAPGRVSLRVFDAAGRRVRTLLEEWATPGRHARHWDGRDDAGRIVSSGVYFYELDVDGQRSTRKLVRLK